MHKRINVVKKYYNNLEYNGPKCDKKKALIEISALTKKIKPEDFNNISDRFFNALHTIQKNFCIFESACDHVDTICYIMKSLNRYAHNTKFSNQADIELYDKLYGLFFGFFHLNVENEVVLFLETAIATYRAPGFKGFKESISIPNTEMIILEDSDLYAVISHLRIIKESCLNKIFVQAPIKENFLSLLKKHIKRISFSIEIFKSKQELFISRIENKLNILSIWSEDIIAVKRLAKSLTHELVFINTYMDFYTSFVVPPPATEPLNYPVIVFKTGDTSVLTPTSIMQSEMIYPIYNLFYDGTWHKPVQNRYWTYNYCKYADATKEDFEKCFESAKRGHKIWNAWTTESRKLVLFKFASILKCNGKFELSNVVAKWLKYQDFQHYIIKQNTKRLETTIITEPKGITYILEQDEAFLFQILTRSLITGNSVIVITTKAYNQNSCDLLPYCDMFSTSGIPSGVVNVISSTRFLGRKGSVILKQAHPTKIQLSLINCRTIILPLR